MRLYLLTATLGGRYTGGGGVTRRLYSYSMTVFAPNVLGRGVVITEGANPPSPWLEAPRTLIDDETLQSPKRRNELIDSLHRLWVSRTPHVIEWACDNAALGIHETDERPVYEVPLNWLPPLERLRFLCFSNNYDARGDEIVWWWSRKAEAYIACSPSDVADAVIDGVDTWIDGGPRQPLDQLLDRPMVSYETVELGSTASAPVLGTSADDLATDQREAVEHGVGAARIIAPAGSGKTRTLAARLRLLLDSRGVSPTAITALAYNDRAAAELRERLGVGRDLARTIHSLGWEILRNAWPGMELIGEPEVRRVLERFITVPRRSNTDVMGPYVEALDRVRAGLVDPATVESERDDIPGFAVAFEQYRAYLYHQGSVDHGEQVYGAIEALLRDSDLRQRWQQRCRHLLVDEFQDLTPAFLLLIRLVASPELNVFAVGDDDQVIYGYAGADPSFLIDFDDYFPGAGQHMLTTNYRCPVPVVDATMNLLSHNQRRIDKKISSHSSISAKDSLAVTRVSTDSLAPEAAAIINNWRDGGRSLEDIAVLSRVNAALIPVKAALAETGVPTKDNITAQSLQRTAARALFAWLRVAIRPDTLSRQDVMDIVRRPSRGLNLAATEYLPRGRFALDDLGAVSGRLDDKPARRWDEFVADILSAAAVAQTGDSLATIRHITTTIGLASAAGGLDSGRTNASRPSHTDDLVAIERCAALHRNLDDFQPWLVDTLNIPSDPAGVLLSSVHRVKGMEWPHVIVFGADAGTIPHALSEDHEEERRVFHVAITRGIEQVTVLASRERPSPFLRELTKRASATDRKVEPKRTSAAIPKRGGTRRGKTIVAGDRVSVFGYEATVLSVEGPNLEIRLDGGATMTAKVTEIRKVLPRTLTHGPRDERVVEVLKEWRLETSQSLSVPAYVVLHDKTIDEIASAKPATEADLLAIAGIGANKLEHYGDDILRIVQEQSEDSG